MRKTFLPWACFAISLNVFAACPTPEQVSAVAGDWLALTPVTAIDAAIAAADAECFQKELVRQLTASRGQPVGYKAGLTNKAVQQRFGVDAPVRGTLLEQMLLPDGTRLPARFGTRPLMESDLLVEVADEGINAARTPEEVMAHLKAIIPFIELPDLVVDPKMAMNGPLLVAINVGARLGVKGQPLPARPELVESLGRMSVVLKDQRGVELGRGPGSAILGHPLNAVLWLTQDLARSGGRLKAGDLLSLGAFTAPLPPTAGQTVTVTYEGLPGNPSVSVGFQ